MLPRSLRSSLRPLFPALLLGMAGCASLGGTRPAVPQQVRTITSIGDRPVSVVAGEPGASVVADAGPSTLAAGRTPSEPLPVA